MLSFPTANENSLSLSLHKESRFTHQYKIEGDKTRAFSAKNPDLKSNNKRVA